MATLSEYGNGPSDYAKVGNLLATERLLASQGICS